MLLLPASPLDPCSCIYWKVSSLLIIFVVVPIVKGPLVLVGIESMAFYMSFGNGVGTGSFSGLIKSLSLRIC